MKHRDITCLYNRLSANAFLLWARLPGMPSLRLHLRSCIPRLRVFRHPQPDVIFPIPYRGLCAVCPVAYTASCRMPSVGADLPGMPFAALVHTGLRCGRLPWRKPTSWNVCLYNRLSANAFCLVDMPTVHALATLVHTRLRAFRHPQPDVIFLITCVYLVGIRFSAQSAGLCSQNQ